MMQILVQGGGIAFVGGPVPGPPGPWWIPAQHVLPFGKLQNITFTIVNSTIQGNLAEEGGGVWSSWPVNIHNCSIVGNTALRVVSITAAACRHVLKPSLKYVIGYCLLEPHNANRWTKPCFKGACSD
jgi:hypothetical protein